MLKALLISILSFVAVGCYEGWDYEKDRPGNGGDPSSTPTPTSEPKTIYYILYQPVMMDESGTNASRCMPNSGIAEYKRNEWTLRAEANAAALEAITENFAYVPIVITSTDCTKLGAIASAAVTQSPWGSKKAPEQDPDNRVAIHLKGGLWDEEPILSPNSTVKKEDWAAWQTIKAGGRNAVSLHNFVISNGGDGYFAEWSGAQKSDKVLNGTAIDDVDPTQTGIEKRKEIVAGDASKLAQWVLQWAATANAEAN
jgi:hypothetical protein